MAAFGRKTFFRLMRASLLSTGSRSSKFSERFRNFLETAGGDHQSFKPKKFNGIRYERELFRLWHELMKMVGF